MSTENGLKIAIRRAGGLRALGRKLGISYQSIQKWVEINKVSEDWLIEVERVTRVPREKLRPDLFKGVKVTREKELEPV